MTLAAETGSDLVDILRRVNAGRAGGHAPDWCAMAEDMLQALFRPSEKLAVYGTLKPIGPSFAMFDPFGGTWVKGQVRGRLHSGGWGAAPGLPVLEWDPGGDVALASMLVSPALSASWGTLDQFAGPDLVRALIPFENSSGVIAIANAYTLRVRQD